MFHQFGRLAQISLKSAYGFVQYHTIAEGHAAMQGAQGIELGGRKIREFLLHREPQPRLTSYQTWRSREPKRRRTKETGLRTVGAHEVYTGTSDSTPGSAAVGGAMTIVRAALPRHAAMSPVAAETAISLATANLAIMGVGARGRLRASTVTMMTRTGAGVPAPTAGPLLMATGSICRAALGLTSPTCKSCFSRKCHGTSSAGFKALSILKG